MRFSPKTVPPLGPRHGLPRRAVIAILDSDPELSQADIIALRDLPRDIRPDMRDLVLTGLEAGAQRAEARRAGFARQLTITGAIAIAVILGLTAVLMVLDRLLARADQRDTELMHPLYASAQRSKRHWMPSSQPTKPVKLLSSTHPLSEYLAGAVMRS